MRYGFHTLDVFTDRVFGGNPLAVFPDATGIPEDRMRHVAREFNYSETVFVLPPETPQGTRRLRIFTPSVELPFAGHPTIGTALLLAMLGEVPLQGEETRIVLEEGVGPVPVLIRAREGRPDFAQLTAARPPEVGPAPPPLEELAEVLSLSPGEIGAEGMAPAAVSSGTPFLVVPLADRDALARARVDRARFDRVLGDAWASKLYLVAPGLETDFRARMFGPSIGIEEDPATGAAAVAFAAYLALRDASADATLRWTVEQGVEMGRPSLLHLEAERRGGEVVATRVGGAAVRVSEGSMLVPPVLL